MLINKLNKYFLAFMCTSLFVSAAIVLHLQYKQSQLLGSSIDLHEHSVTWDVFQLEREALRFIKELDELMISSNEKSQKDIRLYFEIFWSRLEILEHNDQTDVMLDPSEHNSVVQDLSRYLHSVEPLIYRENGRLKREEILDIRERLTALLAELQAISSSTIHIASKNALVRQEEITKQIRISTGTMIFQFAMTGIFFFAALWLVRRLRLSNSTLYNMANFDELTGLPNRHHFYSCLNNDIKRAERNGKQVALMYIDLDNFKDINDTQGHNVGDELLKEAAQRINKTVRSMDTVSRLGGDEFTVILPDLTNVQIATEVSNRILEVLRLPFAKGVDENVISASIGITVFPDDARDVITLLKHADQAMYEAKKNGRNQFHCFTPAMQLEAHRRMQVINDLRVAIDHQQFELHYQPIVDLSTGKINKAEALIRWMHPEKGVISPVEFIPLAEETGLIVPIGDWIFHEAILQTAQWRQTLAADFQLSINTSPVQLRPGGTDIQAWAETLKSVSLDSDAIAIEITEGILMDGPASERLPQMQQDGFLVSLDDFGTGYSTLSYLKRFDINYLKIDQGFVRNLSPDSSDYALCEAIIEMAHKLEIKVIAEGIETESQRRYLTAMGCDFGQGYLFSKPIPAVEFEELVRAYNGTKPS